MGEGAETPEQRQRGMWLVWPSETHSCDRISSSFCKTRSQNSRGVSTKWMRCTFPHSPLSLQPGMSCSAWEATVGLGTTKVVRQALQNMQPTAWSRNSCASRTVRKSRWRPDAGYANTSHGTCEGRQVTTKTVRVAYGKRFDRSHYTFCRSRCPQVFSRRILPALPLLTLSEAISL